MSDTRIVPADAIVIERSELPEVRVAQTHPRLGWVQIEGIADWITQDHTPEYLRDLALLHLAAAEWLQAHPLDEPAQVRAIAEALAADRADDDGTSWHDLTPEAERLYQLGIRVPEVTERTLTPVPATRASDVITTPQELEALPLGSVIVDREGGAGLVRDGAGSVLFPEVADLVPASAVIESFGPLTVLHRADDHQAVTE